METVKFKDALKETNIKSLDAEALNKILSDQEMTWRLHRTTWDSAAPVRVGFDRFFPEKTYPRDKKGYPQGMDLSKLDDKKNMLMDILRMLFNRCEALNILDNSVKDVNDRDITVYARIQRLIYAIDDAYELVFRFMRSYERVLCPSSTTDVSKESDKVFRTYVIDINDDKLSSVTKLLLALYNETERQNLRKFKDCCMKEIRTPEGYRTRAWTKTCTIKEFVNKTFKKHTNFEMWKIVSSGNGPKAVQHMTDAGDDLSFKEIKKDRHMWSFRNGILRVSKDEEGYPHVNFHPYGTEDFDDSLCSSKYFDAHLDYDDCVRWDELETPNLDKILMYQNFPREIINWFFIFAGRLCFDVGECDKWEIIPFLLGMAGTGKSTLTMLLKKFYDHVDVGTLSNNIQTTFGLANIMDCLMFIAPEVKKDLRLEQAEFQSMVSGEPVSVNVKFEKAAQLERWTTPGILAGNEVPDWRDNSGSILRRLVTFDFGKIIKKGDTDGEMEKKLERELPIILVKCVRGYCSAVRKYRNKGIWSVLPKYFVRIQEQLGAITNPLRFFLQSEDFEYGDDYMISFTEFQSEFKRFCEVKSIRMPRFTSDFYTGPLQARGLDVQTTTGKNSEGHTVKGKFVLGLRLIEEETKFVDDDM